MFSFVKITTKLSNFLYHFSFPPAVNESSCCSISLSAFDVVRVLDFGRSNRCVLMSHDYLTWILLMIYDVEHLFICLFAICMSSLLRCLLRSLNQFLIGLFTNCSNRALPLWVLHFQVFCFLCLILCVVLCFSSIWRI